MKLRTRLVLFGAVLPGALLVTAMVVGGLLFQRALFTEHDRALLTQAAVEAVSLFDRADGPHLHLALTPIEVSPPEMVASGALYGPDGQLVTVFPPDADVPERVDPSTVAPQSTLHTELRAKGETRVLQVRVEDVRGRAHCLWLGAPLARHQRTMTTYWRVTGLVIVATVLLGLLVQWAHARELVGRIGLLVRQMAAIGSGRFPTGELGAARDDELGELARAIDRTSATLELARRAQDRLVADAAHELRTPLASVRARIEVTLRRQRSSEQLRECLEGVAADVARLSDLATGLLDLAALRAAPVHRQPGDLAPVVVEAVDQGRALAEARSIAIGLDAPAHAPGVLVPTALRQAVDNVLANAIEHSPEGGRIDVQLCERDGQWCITVEDEGPGLDEADLELVFEPFYRARGSGSGKGLGLAIAREVTTMHDGSAVIENREGGGARVRLCVGTTHGESPS